MKSLKNTWRFQSSHYVAGVTALVGVLSAACTGQVGSTPGGGAMDPGTGGTGSGSGATNGAGAGKSTGGTTGTGKGGSGSGATGTGATGTGGGATAGAGNASSGGDGTGATGGVPAAKPISLTGEPIYTRFMRLTNDQWENSVTDILRLTAKPGLSSSFEVPVAGSTDFSNNELVLSVTNSMWSSYQIASETVAVTATGSTTALSALYTGTDRDGFIADFGRRAFRRTLTTAELADYGALFDVGSAMMGTGTPFAKGAALVIRGMLQSPFFLYRSELAAEGAPLTGFEVASKLSFWLRNTTPSDQLLDAAEAGQLDTPEGVASQAMTMLGEPAAAEMMKRFHSELYHFGRFANVDKAGVAGYTTALNPELEEASTRYFDRIFTQGLGIREVLTSTVGYVGPQLAKLYGVTAPSGMVEKDLGATRGGFFAQVPFLVLYSLNSAPDSIHRGVSINLDVLCADPGVPNIQLPPIPEQLPDETNRERITALTDECGECHHNFINPIGFAFEDFDGMGQFRELDNGKPIDTSGAYPFAEGFQSYVGSQELMQIMATGKQAHACYAKKLSGFAMQRDMVMGDMPLLDTLAEASLADGGSIKNVAVELVKNPAFRTRVGGAL